MREAFQKGINKLPEQATQGRKVESVQGTFDDFSKAGLGKGEADAVIIAQAFHWCPDYEGALVCVTLVGTDIFADHTSEKSHHTSSLANR
jgi:hypothetical protein